MEEFQKNAGALLEAVERGEQFIIARGQKAVARLLHAEDEGVTDTEREESSRAAMAALALAYQMSRPHRLFGLVACSARRLTQAPRQVACAVHHTYRVQCMLIVPIEDEMAMKGPGDEPTAQVN